MRFVIALFFIAALAPVACAQETDAETMGESVVTGDAPPSSTRSTSTNTDPQHAPAPAPRRAALAIQTVTLDAGVLNENSVLVLPLKRQIDTQLLFFMRRGLTLAHDSNVSAVIIDMDTPGGGLEQTKEIINRIRSLIASDIPVYVLVNDEAISAGAIISLACSGIYMTPTATIGDAMPIMLSPGGVQEVDDRVHEKMSSPTRALVRGLAEERGYRADVAEAMVDPRVVLQIGETVVCDNGELLTMTASEASRIYPPMTTPLLARGVVTDLDDLVYTLGLGDASVVQVAPTGSERLAYWLTMLAPVLMAGLMLGFYTEMNTPGFGIAGIAAICCGVVLWYGHYIAGLAGHEDLLLLGLGVVLLAVEIFILPGFGVCGIIGLGCLCVGLFMAMMPVLPDAAPALPGLPPINFAQAAQPAAYNFAMAIVIGGAGIYILARVLPRTPFYNRLVLSSTLSPGAGYTDADVETRTRYVGQPGVAITPLRPAGTASIDGQRVDVVTDGDFIDNGETVRVKKVEGLRVVVVRDAPPPAEEGPAVS